MANCCNSNESTAHKEYHTRPNHPSTPQERSDLIRNRCDPTVVEKASRVTSITHSPERLAQASNSAQTAQGDSMAPTPEQIANTEISSKVADYPIITEAAHNQKIFDNNAPSKLVEFFKMQDDGDYTDQYDHDNWHMQDSRNLPVRSERSSSYNPVSDGDSEPSTSTINEALDHTSANVTLIRNTRTELLAEQNHNLTHSACSLIISYAGGTRPIEEKAIAGENFAPNETMRPSLTKTATSSPQNISSVQPQLKQYVLGPDIPKNEPINEVELSEEDDMNGIGDMQGFKNILGMMSACNERPTGISNNAGEGRVRSMSTGNSRIELEQLSSNTETQCSFLPTVSSREYISNTPTLTIQLLKMVSTESKEEQSHPFFMERPKSEVKRSIMQPCENIFGGLSDKCGNSKFNDANWPTTSKEAGFHWMTEKLLQHGRFQEPDHRTQIREVDDSVSIERETSGPHDNGQDTINLTENAPSKVISNFKEMFSASQSHQLMTKKSSSERKKSRLLFAEEEEKNLATPYEIDLQSKAHPKCCPLCSDDTTMLFPWNGMHVCCTCRQLSKIQEEPKAFTSMSVHSIRRKVKCAACSTVCILSHSFQQCDLCSRGFCKEACYRSHTCKQKAY